MNLRGPGRSRQTRLPLGATGATRSANSDTSRHPLPSLAAVMSAPERQNMPHLHPQKLNGSLWFDRHDCIRKDIVASWQADFWGPWWKYSMCPQHKKDAWWTSFVQKYYWKPEVHDMVLACWQKELDKSIRNLVFKRKRDAKKPPYIGLADWGLMQDAWKDPAFQARSKINSKNKRSDPDGLGTPCHTSGAKRHSRVADEMAIEAGGVPPSAADLVRKTHTKKDGTYVDKRAEAKVNAAKELARQRLEESNMNSENGSSVTEPSNEMLTAAYIEVATNTKRQVYGLGSAQYVNADPNESAAASLRRNLDVQMRMNEMEGTVVKVNEVVTEVKEDVTCVKKAMEVLLRINGLDPITFQPISRTEDASSAPSPHSESAHDPSQFRK